MYKLVITINNQHNETYYFETWQSAYKSLSNHLCQYSGTHNLEFLLRVINPNGKLLKSIGLLTNDDGTGIEWDNIENENIRALMRIFNNNQPTPAPSYAVDNFWEDNDYPF